MSSLEALYLNEQINKQTNTPSTSHPHLLGIQRLKIRRLHPLNSPSRDPLDREPDRRSPSFPFCADASSVDNSDIPLPADGTSPTGGEDDRAAEDPSSPREALKVTGSPEDDDGAGVAATGWCTIGDFVFRSPASADSPSGGDLGDAPPPPAPRRLDGFRRSNRFTRSTASSGSTSGHLPRKMMKSKIGNIAAMKKQQVFRSDNTQRLPYVRSRSTRCNAT